MKRSLAFGLVLVLVCAGAIPAIAAPEYAVDASPAVDTPTRTVEFEGQEFTISSVARVDPGESVSASVAAPSGEANRVLLYDADRNIVDFRRATGSTSVTFETADSGGTYDPGSYMLVLSHDGVHEAAQPLVLSAYRVDVSAPSDAVEGDRIEVTASVDPVAGDEPIEGVAVVIGDDDRDRRVDLERTGDGRYGASLEMDRLPPGAYSLHAVVQGPDEVFGSQELIGVSDAQSFEVAAEETESEEPPNSGGGSGGSSGAADADDDPTATPTPTDTPVPTTSTTIEGTSTATEEPSTETAAGTGTLTNDVVTPSGDSATEPGPTPLLGGLQWQYAALPVVAILLLLLWVRRRG